MSTGPRPGVAGALPLGLGEFVELMLKTELRSPAPPSLCQSFLPMPVCSSGLSLVNTSQHFFHSVDPMNRALTHPSILPFANGLTIDMLAMAGGGPCMGP